MAIRPGKVWNGTGWDDIGDARMLTHDHSGGANGAAIPQGLKLITAQTFSGTGVAVNSCFSATYDNYRVLVKGTTADNALCLTLFRVRSGSTDRTDDDYGWARSYSSGTTLGAAGVYGSTNMEMTGWHNSGTTMQWVLSFDVMSPALNEYTYIHGQGGAPQFGSSIGLGYFGFQFSGWSSAKSAFDGFSLIIPASSGTVKVYGYHN